MLRTLSSELRIQSLELRAQSSEPRVELWCELNWIYTLVETIPAECNESIDIQCSEVLSSELRSSEDSFGAPRSSQESPGVLRRVQECSGAPRRAQKSPEVLVYRD